MAVRWSWNSLVLSFQLEKKKNEARVESTSTWSLFFIRISDLISSLTRAGRLWLFWVVVGSWVQRSTRERKRRMTDCLVTSTLCFFLSHLLKGLFVPLCFLQDLQQRTCMGGGYGVMFLWWVVIKSYFGRSVVCIDYGKCLSSLIDWLLRSVSWVSLVVDWLLRSVSWSGATRSLSRIGLLYCLNGSI